MKFYRLILAVLFCCVGVWAALSYQNGRAMAPPLDPFGRGEWYYLASQYDESAAAYHEALKVGLPESKVKEARFKLARALHEGKRYGQALRAYEEFVRAYPQSDEANRVRGYVEWIQQNAGITR